jgi:hypothetical protein
MRALGRSGGTVADGDGGCSAVWRLCRDGVRAVQAGSAAARAGGQFNRVAEAALLGLVVTGGELRLS